MKKLFIIFLSLNLVFFTTFYIFSSNVHANVASKPLVIAAKKALKDVATDTAVQMAEHIIFEKMINDFVNGDAANLKDGYSPVCLDGTVSKVSDCAEDKRVQVKKEFDSNDKKILQTQIEREIEKKTVTDKKFGKFLDFFIPLFLVSGTIEFVSTALDSDSESLIDDIAQQSLINSGLMLPLYGAVDASKWNP